MILFVFAALAALQVADVWTTLAFLKLGGREKNPLARRAMEKFGAVKGLVGAKVLVMGLVFLFLDAIPIWMLLAACLGYVGIVWNNVKLIRKLRN